MPEILRSDVTSVVLTLKRLGVQNLAKFDFLSPPPSQALVRALEALFFLGALDGDGAITELGKTLADFPLEPQLAKCLLVAPQFFCLPEILSIVAMLSVPSVFSRTVGRRRGLRETAGMRSFGEDEEELAGGGGDENWQNFADPESEHITLMRMCFRFVLLRRSFEAFQRVREEDRVLWCTKYGLNCRSLNSAVSVREQLCGIVDRLRLPLVQNPLLTALERKRNVRRCLCCGFFMQSAVFDHDGFYLTAKDNEVESVEKG